MSRADLFSRLDASRSAFSAFLSEQSFLSPPPFPYPLTFIYLPSLCHHPRPNAQRSPQEVANGYRPRSDPLHRLPRHAGRRDLLGFHEHGGIACFFFLHYNERNEKEREGLLLR